jgi:uncharacterized lipoprotein YddW (UPF0748 family)
MMGAAHFVLACEGRRRAWPLAFGIMLLVSACTPVGRVPASRAPAPAVRAEPAVGSTLRPDTSATESAVVTEPNQNRLVTSRLNTKPVRGVWVVRTSLSDPARIHQLVADAKANGITTLLVQVRGRADAFYRSSIEPRAAALAALPGDFDPLALLLTEAHAAGIEVHAWIATHLVWGLAPLPDDPAHLVNAHPEWLTVPRSLAGELARLPIQDPAWRRRLREWTVAQDGRVEGLYTDPAHPEVSARVLQVIAELLHQYPIDGLHLDYIRYGSPEFGYSNFALDAFRSAMLSEVSPARAAELDAAAMSDVTAWASGEPEAFNRFREQQITALVEQVSALRDDVRPDVQLTAAVFADPNDARRARFQNWPEWLERGLVDAMVPMAYTSDVARFADLLQAARTADGGRGRIWMGLGVYLAPFEAVTCQMALAASAGVGGLVFFSWDWMADAPAPSADGPGWLPALSRELERGAPLGPACQ